MYWLTIIAFAIRRGVGCAPVSGGISRARLGAEDDEIATQRHLAFLLAIGVYSAVMYTLALEKLGIDTDVAFTCLGWASSSTRYVAEVFANPPVASKLAQTFNVLREGGKLRLQSLKDATAIRFHDEITRFFNTRPAMPLHLSKQEVESVAVRKWLFTMLSASAVVRARPSRQVSTCAWLRYGFILFAGTVLVGWIAMGCIYYSVVPVSSLTAPLGLGAAQPRGCKDGALHAASWPLRGLGRWTYSYWEQPEVDKQCYLIQQSLITAVESGTQDTGYRVRCVDPAYLRKCSAVDECVLPTVQCDDVHFTRWLNATHWTTSSDLEDLRVLDFDQALAHVRSTYEHVLTASWIWKQTTVGVVPGMRSCRFLERAWTNPTAGPKALRLSARAKVERLKWWSSAVTLVAVAVLSLGVWFALSKAIAYSDRPGDARPASGPGEPGSGGVSGAGAAVIPLSRWAMSETGDPGASSYDSVLGALEDESNYSSLRMEGESLVAPRAFPLDWFICATEYLRMATRAQRDHVVRAFRDSRSPYAPASGKGWTCPISHLARFFPDVPTDLEALEQPVAPTRTPGFAALRGAVFVGPAGVESGAALYLRCFQVGLAIMHVSLCHADGTSPAVELYEVLESVGWVAAVSTGAALEQLHQLLVQMLAQWEEAVCYGTSIEFALKSFTNSAPTSIVALQHARRGTAGLAVAHAVGDAALVKQRESSMLYSPIRGGGGRARG